jgi:transcriptional regulator with XRE-family HTH domain
MNQKARQLGGELRRLRELRGLSGEAVAKRFRWSPSKVSRAEHGKGALRPTDVQRMLELYGVAGPHAQRVVALAAAAVDEKADRPVPLEEQADAGSVRMWAPVAFPAPLRAYGYALAYATQSHDLFRTSPREIRRGVDGLMSWHDRLAGADSQTQLLAVVDESVLRRGWGGEVAMQAQLEHVLRLTELAAVEVRVLPMDSGRARAIAPFTHVTFDDHFGVDGSDAVAVEALEGRAELDDEEVVYWYRLAFDELWEGSATVAESAEMMKRALAELRP